jgi:hypothetical protein
MHKKIKFSSWLMFNFRDQMADAQIFFLLCFVFNLGRSDNRKLNSKPKWLTHKEEKMSNMGWKELAQVIRLISCDQSIRVREQEDTS